MEDICPIFVAVFNNRMQVWNIQQTTGVKVNLSNCHTLFFTLQANTHVFAKYFDLRTVNFFKVMPPVFNVDTYWYMNLQSPKE